MIQNRFYNGWIHDHYVSNVLMLAPNERIISCALNAPCDVSWNLEDKFQSTGGKCVVDSAFCKALHPFLIKSSREFSAVVLGVEEVIQDQQATSARQAAAWGMRTLQGSFPRIKDRIA